MKRIYFIIIAVLCMLYIVSEVRKGKFSIRESFWWVIASLIMILLAIFPYSIDHLAKVFGIAYPPSLLFVFCIIFLVFINFRNSKKIAKQQDQLVDLAEQVAVLKFMKKNESEKK